jgi:hypothetical protein
MGTLFSGTGTAAGGTGNFSNPGAFRTFFPIHFSIAIAYWAPYRLLAVTRFTSHNITFHFVFWGS